MKLCTRKYDIYTLYTQIRGLNDDFTTRYAEMVLKEEKLLSTRTDIKGLERMTHFNDFNPLLR